MFVLTAVATLLGTVVPAHAADKKPNIVAGALSEVGSPQGHIPVALLFFSIGVEIGQLLFISAVLALFALGTRAATSFKYGRIRLPHLNLITAEHAATLIALLPLYAIGGVAMFWVILRLAAF